MSRAVRPRWEEPALSADERQAAAAPPLLARPAAEQSRVTPAREDVDALDLVRQAEALELPWKRILSEEIVAETVLRRFLGEDLRNLPLWRLLCILPGSPLHSWRVRERVDRLAWEASQGLRRARQELTQLHAKLSGSRGRRRQRGSSLALHQWFAYQRVLELRAVAELAHRAPAGADPVEFLVRSLGCSRADAQWGVEGPSSRTSFYALELAMRRTRDEGFDIPHAQNEHEAFLRLRACVRRNGFLPRRASSERPPAPSRALAR